MGHMLKCRFPADGLSCWFSAGNEKWNDPKTGSFPTTRTGIPYLSHQQEKPAGTCTGNTLSASSRDNPLCPTQLPNPTNRPAQSQHGPIAHGRWVKIGAQHETLGIGNMDQNRRSNSCWCNFDPRPNDKTEQMTFRAPAHLRCKAAAEFAHRRLGFAWPLFYAPLSVAIHEMTVGENVYPRWNKTCGFLVVEFGPMPKCVDLHFISRVSSTQKAGHKAKAAGALMCKVCTHWVGHLAALGVTIKRGL